ncbi:hypothetical protein [Oricola cellulosilytica]|uniref:Metal-binding protein n=1 Tax=Oricola cellulosilytica TaxID=1429082 RepID=A0A4R0PJT4_9HYPH|nr:hypothetical protein [Oricola cellulosilytica]TCD16610.1 hypothetical protein E0D97_04120 [Oricola cellulosilytica]
MPLENRVTPSGEIVADPARGLFTGNRGILHDAATRTLDPRKRWTSKAWICCVCNWRGRRRDVMGFNGRKGRAGWTELFFLDEATALAAGHRPCFSCRREDAKRFQAAWAAGNGGGLPKAREIDAILHAERLDNRNKRLHPLPCPAIDLPDGTVVAGGRTPLLIRNGRAWHWSFSGYSSPRLPPADLVLLTPPSTVRALRAGYSPVIHSSALHYPPAAGN